MSGKVFAFQIARPLETAPEEQGSLDAQYDPQTQSMLWQGQTRAQAVLRYCTAHHNALQYCSSDNISCSAWGKTAITGGYFCDSVY